MHVVHDHLALPESCRLGKRVSKRLFFDNADLSATDRRAFTDDVDSIIWQYTLKPATLAVNPYRDGEREYPELAVLDIDLRNGRRGARIAEIVHRAIPYPLLLVLAHDGQFALSTAHKRASRAEQGAVVAEDIQTTSWISAKNPDELEQSFLDSLALARLPQTHLHVLYAGWHQRLLAQACARLTGEFRPPSLAESHNQRRERLADCHRLEGELTRLRAEIRKETRFNRQVELNTLIKQLEQQLRQAIAGL